jgi:hypothetical protein
MCVRYQITHVMGSSIPRPVIGNHPRRLGLDPSWPARPWLRPCQKQARSLHLATILHSCSTTHYPSCPSPRPRPRPRPRVLNPPRRQSITVRIHHHQSEHARWTKYNGHGMMGSTASRLRDHHCWLRVWLSPAQSLGERLGGSLAEAGYWLQLAESLTEKRD